MEDEKRARLYRIAMLPITGQFVILLEDIEGTRLLPIFIGRSEGESILIKLQNVELPRPITHDLIVNLFNAFNIFLKKVTVTDLKENTYFAELTLVANGKDMIIDARPSDAIAIAIRTGAEIYISKKVFDKCPNVPKPISQEEVEDFKTKLESLNPADFFKDLNEES